MSVMGLPWALSRGVAHPMTVIDQCCAECVSRSQPGMGINGNPSPEIDTGGER